MHATESDIKKIRQSVLVLVYVLSMYLPSVTCPSLTLKIIKFFFQSTKALVPLNFNINGSFPLRVPNRKLLLV
jgi:hypothetical protein